MNRISRARILLAFIAVPVTAAATLAGAASAGATTSGAASSSVTTSAASAPIASGSHAAPRLLVSHQPVRMFAYDRSHFASAAAKLPAGLVDALARDLHISGETYLADADASSRAVQVVDSLTSHGVHVLGSSIAGTALTVNVASTADVAAVTAVGATAVVGAPKAFDLGDRKAIAASNPLYDGEAYYWADNDYFHQCSIGFTGFAKPSQAQQFATAGHCFTGTEQPAGAIFALSSATPRIVSGARWDLAFGDGQVASASSNYQFGSGNDSGLMNVASGVTQTTDVATWGGKTASASGSGGALPYKTKPLTLTGETSAIKGAHLCKSGSRTGWSCGKVLAVNESVSVYGDDNVPHTVNSIIATTCILPGDSGGSAVIGTLAAGIDSSSTSGTSCSGSKYWAGFFPMVASSGHASVTTQLGSVWEPKVALHTPVVTYPTTQTIVPNTKSLTGTLPGAGSGDTVTVTVSGQAPVSVTASSGTWSFPLSGISGSHTVTVQSAFGSFGRSDTVTKTFAVYPPATFTKPTLSGSSVVDGTLTAHTTITPSGDAVSYQWKAGTTLVGSNQPTYTPTPADYNKKITVTVTGASPNLAWSAPAVSNPSHPIARATITKHSLVVTGHRNVGQELTVSTQDWGPAPVALTYQWYRNGKAIGHATAATYKQTSSDRGRRIDAKVIGTKAGYTTTSTITATHTLTGYTLLSATPVPTISGDATVGQKLTATAGDWAPATVSLSYQWKVGGKAIAKATRSTFTIPTSYVGKVITVTVTGRKTNYAAAAVTSTPTAPIAALEFTTTVTPTISGVVATGNTLTAIRGAWTPTPTYSYQWLRDGVAIAHATSSKYKLVAADSGHDVEVTVTGRKTGYTTVSLTSVTAG